MRTVIYSFLMQCFVFTLLFAQGRLIIPQPPERFEQKQIDLSKVMATVQIKENIASVTLEQTFANPSSFRLEGEYLFAIPDEANINKFYLYIDGKKTEGQVLDSREAHKIYTDIVRSMRDPALLEFAGYGLFKARIFPIEPKSERVIELSYDQIVRFDAGMYRFSLPLRQSGQGNFAQFHLTIDVQSDKELANIYSPSHQVNIERVNGKKVKITFEKNNLPGDKDLILYYALAEKEINANLFSFRPRTDRDGYFLFYAEPGYNVQQTRNIARDFIFVIDVSGSMQGEKMDQARDALRFCMNALDKNDRFDIISFHSSITSFEGQLRNADSDAIANALYFISNLRANGGTNINEALLTALKLKDRADDRPTSIVFLTDGLPTEGEQNINAILQNIKDTKKDFMRIFSFGVGYDVNTFLLDKISADSHGSANYVKPGENIEREVSVLFSKISSPVLTDPEIDFGGVQVDDVYPRKLPDIFKGQSVTVVGRYRGPGQATIRLKGKQGGRERVFTYNLEFQRRESENTFVDNIWANRKIAHLLAQIRFNGENEELVASVKALGEEYGIVTPYTSYLVTEERRELANVEQRVLDGVAPSATQRLQTLSLAREMASEQDEESLGSSVFFDAMSKQAAAPTASSGRSAVLSSRIQKKLAGSDKDMQMLITMKRIAGRTFYFREGVWIEHGLKMDKHDVEVNYLSQEYFDWFSKNPELKEILAIGENILFQWKDKIYRVADKR